MIHAFLESGAPNGDDLRTLMREIVASVTQVEYPTGLNLSGTLSFESIRPRSVIAANSAADGLLAALAPRVAENSAHTKTSEAIPFANYLKRARHERIH
jgi:hypothetical protein